VCEPTEGKRRPSRWLVLVGDTEMVLVGPSRLIYTVKMCHKCCMNVTLGVECHSDEHLVFACLERARNQHNTFERERAQTHTHTHTHTQLKDIC